MQKMPKIKSHFNNRTIFAPHIFKDMLVVHQSDLRHEMPLIEFYQIMANNGTMILELKKPIFFVGMMGAGKTAVGRATADILGVPFLDSDAEIEYAANMSISEIFERDGEDYFREKEEEQVISRLCGAGPCVISTGGGAFIRPSVKELLMQEGVAVWIKADLELLWSRVKLKAVHCFIRLIPMAR